MMRGLTAFLESKHMFDSRRVYVKDSIPQNHGCNQKPEDIHKNISIKNDHKNKQKGRKTEKQKTENRAVSTALFEFLPY